MTSFIDTSVIMYAAGGSHPMQAPCQTILDRVFDRSLDAVTSVEVVQEILHRYISLRRSDEGVALSSRTMDLFAPVLPITHAVLRRVPDLADRYPELQARDLVHAATCLHEGLDEIISSDRGFDHVAGLRRVDPLAFGT